MKTQAEVRKAFWNAHPEFKSKTMTTIEKNEMIGRFMGLRIYPEKGKEKQWKDHRATSKGWKGEPCDFEAFSLKYHESWDWLLPVIREIQSLCEEPEQIDHIKDALWLCDIETVHGEVFEWIQEYNKQKEQNT